ncbi:ankyrin repeat-containing protein At5g02620-like [Rhodamnia argentea]|uniref:Ankyrin repeat-containing protein At5g02620-like n=1 Tax=Rhodamnia argentea TaxID=178133 RepID=A0A8B8QUJ3_9MYRT|nr:ankyrin repeat-containing protein At5g02620-like [Rhodamnia argentea]
MHPKVYEAAKSGDFDSLNAIISGNGEDLFHLTTPKGNNILHVAAQHKQVHFIELLLQCPSGPSLLWQGNYRGDTPLHLAAKVGSCRAVLVFTDLAKSLRWVVENGQVDACKELLRKQNLHKDTALHCALKGRHHYWVVKLLIEEDPQLCDITNAADESPLYLAASRGFPYTAELMLGAFSLSSSHKGPKGLTALHAAVYWSSTWWPKFLEKRPEVIREGDDLGWTPLHYFASWDNVEAVGLLLQHDASVAYIADKEGQSALHVAAFLGKVNAIDELIRSCPDAGDIMNDKGQTALHAAVIGGRVNVVKYILGTPDLEDLVNEQDADGNTALHLAVLHKQYNIIYKLARDKRVDRLATNKDHSTAIEIFDSHKEVGYRAEKVRHVLNGSRGILGSQSYAIEYAKKRLHKQVVEIQAFVGQPAVTITAVGSNTSRRETFDLSKRKIVELELLVAVLIATVTFAVAFTVPGGYNDDGMAILAGRAAFKAFMISNTTAFGFSILALFLLYDTSFFSDHQQRRYTGIAKLCTYVGIVGMVLAFACGMHVVSTRTTWLGIFPYVMIGCLVTMYNIGAFLDPEVPIWWLRWSPREKVRTLLFDYGIL